jgi:hypothetical protein
MEIEFDPDKDAANIAKHGISLVRAADIEFLAVEADLRFVYPERRFRGWGPIDGRLYCLAFTWRGKTLRPISLRRVHRKEALRNVPQDPGRHSF